MRWYYSNGRKWRGTKKPLDEVKEESEKLAWNSVFKKLGSWCLVSSLKKKIEGEKVEAMTDLIFLGSVITVESNCSHEIKRCSLLGRKAMTNLDSIIKSRDITLPTKIHIIKVIVFPVVMYKCESCTIKKAECRRTDALGLWCWRRLLRSWSSNPLATWCEELIH